MKKPGSMRMAQKRRPQVSMRKIAGIVPRRRAPPPTSLILSVVVYRGARSVVTYTHVVCPRGVEADLVKED